ncbi:hypothetical protein [Mucilaginibacter dorajii]|uniref:hypothetical protein n=1 Tax=Mucilaginibacter dorajii TaxID=692994 RepID=UPI00216A391C|nr:hypothetical protein [Mucilaginibacter dorajii]MCS3735943.1 hypothetical protein [Mucilaginibacter dorajii]
MKREQNIFKELQVLFVASCYFFIAVSHIFLLPRLTGEGSQFAISHNSIFKRNSDNATLNAVHVNFIQRTDKVVVNDKKSAIDLLKAVITGFILVFFTLQVWKLKPWQYLFNVPADDCRYAYLSYCSFRI